MQKLIGLLGGKGAGKDTCAKFLVSEYGYNTVSFGEALYREVATAFGVTVTELANRETKETPLSSLSLANCTDLAFVLVVQGETSESHRLSCDDMSMQLFLNKPRSPRFILQYWGTEYKRKMVDDRYWQDRVAAVLDANPTKHFVITDVRFPNETNFIERRGGATLRIRRALLDKQAADERAKNGTAAHDSETALLAYVTNFEIENEEHSPQSLSVGLRYFFQSSPALAT
jgi:hypothetical protein